MGPGGLSGSGPSLYPAVYTVRRAGLAGLTGVRSLAPCMAPLFLRSSVVVLSLVASAGCDTHQTPCTDNCPTLAGSYSLQDSEPLGECAFTPYLLPPTVSLEQSADRRHVTLTVIDPSTRLQVPLTGDVYAPGPGSSSGTVGSFRITTRTVRTVSASEDSIVTLDVTATGSVLEREGRRVLSATLNTQEELTQEGCLATLSVTGQGE